MFENSICGALVVSAAVLVSAGGDAAALDEFVRQLRAEGHSARAAAFDAHDVPKIRAFFGGLARLDVLVNNIGFMEMKSFAALESGDFTATYAATVGTAFETVRAALPALKAAVEQLQLLGMRVQEVRYPSAESYLDHQAVETPTALALAHEPFDILIIAECNAGAPEMRRVDAVTDTIEVDAARGVSRIELDPVTGRSHQLRVHLEAMGHPIIGDDFYGTPASCAKAKRLMLHACEIELVEPVTGRALRIECKAPF